MISDILKVPSPVQEVSFNEKKLFVKRDDLIHKYFSGNKARKFWFLFQKDLSRYTKIVSFGGNQSNAMLSLAAFAKLKGLEFHYFLKPLPRFLLNSPSGNFKAAVDLGMTYTEVASFENINLADPEILFVEQGGAQTEAEFGLKLLAKEIDDFAECNNIKDLTLFLPSGTGTAALYLNIHSKHRVVTTPVAGDSEYLTKQFAVLEPNKNLHPEIIDTEKKYAFGKLYSKFYSSWDSACKQTKIEMEMLYDPKAFLLIEKVFGIATGPVMYIHQGGTLGNETMKARYARFFKNKGISS